MLKRGWTGVVLVVAMVSMASRLAVAQDAPSRDKEIEDLKRRLDLLEKDRDGERPGSNAVSADPVEEKWTDRVKLGGGIRTSLNFSEEDAGNGKDVSRFVSLNSARLYVSAKVTDKISATLNTEFDGDEGPSAGTGPATGSGIRILDAIVQFQFMDEFNIWVGHFLPPSDRMNLDGPYYLSTWGGPSGLNLVGDPYESIFAGRDNGIAFWGDVMGGKFKYQVGLFNGNVGAIPNPVNSKDAPVYAARVTLELLDSEPGYYTQSTYYGTKDVLAIGAAIQSQRDGAVTAAGNKRAVTSGNVDILFEKKLPPDMIGGVITVELAMYWFDAVNATGVFEGDDTSVYIGLYYLMSEIIGWGQLQPFLDYQKVDKHPNSAAAGGDTTQIDVGVNYVIKGHDARITLTWSKIEEHPKGIVVGDNIQRQLILGIQVQF